jgi:hypothetical protein
MGCDIHMFPEHRNEFCWVHVYRHEPDQYTIKDRFPRRDRDNYFAWGNRWYWLFGQLAGVRGGGPPIAEPRGYPEDMDEDVKEHIESYEPDFHTASWLTLEELQKHDWEAAVSRASEDDYFEADDAPRYLSAVRGWLSRLAEIDPDPRKVRIVFAFDN